MKWKLFHSQLLLLLNTKEFKAVGYSHSCKFSILIKYIQEALTLCIGTALIPWTFSNWSVYVKVIFLVLSSWSLPWRIKRYCDRYNLPCDYNNKDLGIKMFLLCIFVNIRLCNLLFKLNSNILCRERFCHHMIPI